ncbi:MAG: hypothetical protein CME31_04495 [Gimesia sp.]|nr:hypothetical protein [Gimesia sp.]
MATKPDAEIILTNPPPTEITVREATPEYDVQAEASKAHSELEPLGDGGTDAEITIDDDRDLWEALPPDFKDFISDQDALRLQYEVNEFNTTGQDSLLKMDPTGKIQSMVKPILTGHEPVMRAEDPAGVELNPTIGMIMEHFVDLTQAVQKAPSIGGQLKRTASLPGQAIEGALRNTLKFFIENTLPDDVQNKFENIGRDMEALGLMDKKGQFLGGPVGLLGTGQEFRERAFFSPEENAWWEDLGAGFGQFAVGLKTIQMLANTKKLLVPSMVADGLVFDPADGSLASMINELDLEPGAVQDMANFMDSTQHDPNMGRAIQVAEGLIIGGILTGGNFAIQNRGKVKDFIKKMFTPGSAGRKAADPAIKKVAEMLTEMKNKWNKKFNFGKYLDDHYGKGWRNVGGGAPVEKARKQKQPSRTEQTGRLDTVHPEINKALQDVLGRMTKAESKRLRKHLTQYAGTPYAAALVRGLTVREFFHRAIQGRRAEARELADSALWGKDSLTQTPTKKYKMGQAFMHSEEAVLDFARSYKFIGDNRKAELDLSGSFKNCDPSPDCAKWCYASIANARPAEFMKSEFIEWVAEKHPGIIADQVDKVYKSTAQAESGLALRINDKGDLSNAQVALIKELNKRGHRVQIFSKRPDMLKKVSDFNLKMLSIDGSNIELARKNPDAQLAVTITDSMTPEMIKELNPRVAVYLPVNMKGGDMSRADVKERFPETFRKMTNKLCPVDGGKMKTIPGTSFVNIVNKTAEPGVWTCTACDKFGAAGCFFGKNQSENARKILNQNKQVNSPTSTEEAAWTKGAYKKFTSDKGLDKEEYWDDLTDEDQAKELAKLRKKTSFTQN